jgi:alkyl sulfatase BDS1-like metallo-beta-lactamase superfamily hydrolase
MSHLVFADPDDGEARRLGADALEQLGYQAESATWRNAYLLGARELRGGTPDLAARAPVSPDVVRAMPLDLFFDYLAVRIDGERAAGVTLALNWTLEDTGERYALSLSNGALTYRGGRQHPRPHATVTLSRATLDRLALRRPRRPRRCAAARSACTAMATPSPSSFGLLDDFRMMFPVVEPPRHGRGAPLDSPVPRPRVSSGGFPCPRRPLD